jgi:UDP-3-O-[3-hydroxymyristoyl] glucosamine N-acyltransferase
MPALTVAQLADICRGQIEGNDQRLISGANSLENATETDLSFAANTKALNLTKSSNAGCLLAPANFPLNGPWSVIRVPEPRAAFARALAALYPKTKPVPSIHPTAIIAATAEVPTTCFVGAHVTIGEHAKIGSGCYIGNGCSIGDHVCIGEDTILHANVTVYDNIRIGARVILHSGCVLGADGFGFTMSNDRYEKFPQVGTVEVDDDVEMGANTCVDRAALGVTRIGQGAKLDNLVHVGHNCDVGKNVVVAAQTGFSGSVVVGDFAVIGGQAGIGEKAKIESKAVIGGKAGILTSQRIHAGEPVWGIPARPLRQHLKGLAHVAKLPALREEVLALRRRIALLESECDRRDDSSS